MKKNSTKPVKPSGDKPASTSSYSQPDRAHVVDRVEDDDDEDEEDVGFSIAAIWENPNRFPARVPAHAW